MNALILRTNGKRELKKLGDDDIAEALGCHFVERFPHTKGYKHPDDWSNSNNNNGTGHSKKGTEHYLSCWVDEEGLLAQRPNNGYAGVLMALNVTLSMGYAVFGDVVIFSRNKSGTKDCAVDPYVVALCEEYEKCEDEDEFFCALEELNGAGLATSSKKSKTTGKTKKTKKVEQKSVADDEKRSLGDDDDKKEKEGVKKGQDDLTLFSDVPFLVG